MERIINYTLLILFLGLFSINLNAQPNKKQGNKAEKDKIEQLKINFINTELKLSAEESEKFWPIYDELTRKLRIEKRIQKTTNNELKNNFNSLTELEFKTKTNKVLDSQIKVAQLNKEYNSKIAEVIGYKKATELLSIERRFKRELLQKLKDK
jgi:hypothetical protein